MTTIKITALSQMGTTIPGPTLVPVVDMSGTPTTKKATIANIANAILSQAGNGYAYAARANLANVAGSATTVIASSQPNITSVGTLTSLTVSGATNLGPIGNVTITGGTVGQVLTTNGSNVLSWTTVAGGGNSTPAGSNTQLQFNDGGVFGGDAGLTFNKTSNDLTVAGNVITEAIQSPGNTNVSITPGTPGPAFIFTTGGALQIPGGHVLESDGDGEFEIKSDSGVVISSDISNTNQHFTFGTDGVFHAPSNVALEGTRLSIGPGAANVSLVAPTVVINANSNVYVQAALTNENANGSADWVAYGTNGSDIGGWTDFGFTGYNFNDANYTVTGPGDGYLFAHAYANGTGGGNLVLATGDHGTHNDIIFATNGFATGNIFGRISDANNSLELTRTGATLTFPDSTEQSTAFTGNIAAANVTGLGNIATINLTSSTSNVLYGNGVFAPVAGGANTGNVTFSNQIVLGTGSNDGGGGLYLAPGNASIANSAVQYLRVRGGDYPTHIHLDTGNNEYYDQYFGADSRYVKLEANGNVVINADDYNGNSGTWTFGSDSVITIPGEIASFITPQVGSNLSIATNDAGGLVGWGSQALSVTYDANIISTYPIGSTIVWQDDTTATITGFDDYGPTYIDIFWDTPKTGTLFPITLETANYAPAIVANASIIVGNNTWTFGNDGKLTFPGTPRIDTTDDNFEVQAAEAINFEANTVVNIYTDAGNNAFQWQFGDDGNLTLPDTTSVIANASITLEANSTGNITGLSVNGDADANLYAYSNVKIVSDSGNREWTFDTTGTLTTPGDITVAGDITGTAAANTLILKAQPNTNTSIQLNSIVDSTIRIDANLEIITDSSNTSQSWNFDIAGNLTLPGNTFAINYANGTQVSLGGGSNIANGNSNVSIATANGNVTISAVGNTTMTVTGTGANVTGTLTSTGKIGYASGSTVTQTTSRGNGVTINALAGTIITTSAAMVATEIDTFSVVNSSVDPNNDIVLAQIVSPNQGTYDCIANPAVIGGFNDGFYINIVNISGFTTSDETITIRFMVIKAPNA